MNITLDDGRTELWQWDTGRKIVVDDESVSEVHYSKYSSTQAITREVIDGKAEIPNFLLQDTHAVTVYAYSGSIENGYTMAEKIFNVVKKPKPANYVETKEDQATLAKLKAEIGDLSALQTTSKNNLVSAINEAAASGGSSDAVLYTEQTLTDAQKKQARENIDAAGDFVITATQDSSGDEITLDKTIAQIQEAISAGKTPVIRIVFAGMSMYLQLITASGTTFIFGGVFSGELGGVLNLIFVGNSGVHHISKGLLSTNQNGELEQQTMAYPPVEAMQIATKKYVDDHAGGGTDMGITGAAVGQIAKITAVDASGTPTAWEPADMPSGGGATTYDIAATASHGGTNQALQGFACSVSSKQLRKAIDAGKTPRLVITIGTLNPLKMYMPMTYYFPVGTEYAYACFGCIGEGYPGAYLYYVICEGESESESESESGLPNWLARSFEATPATS